MRLVKKLIPVLIMLFIAVPGFSNETTPAVKNTTPSEAAARVEQEIRAAVEAVDSEVIPEVRRHSSAALRTLAGKLEKLAAHMDEARADAENSK